jgi:glycerol uptake facilitator-like aquaporin
MRQKLLLEAVGVFFLCLAKVVGGGVLPMAALLAALVYLAAPVAFPHYNPAVTLAFRLRGRLSTGVLGAYLGVQLLAVLAALLVACFILPNDPDRTKEALAVLEQPVFEGLGASLITEGLGSFLFVLVVLVVATSRRTAGNSYFGIVIGLAALGVGGVFAEFDPLINPLVTLTAVLKPWLGTVFEGSAGAKGLVTESLLLAKLAPRFAGDIGAQLAGGALAAWLFRTVLPEER